MARKRYCHMCVGTGIAYSGPVEGACDVCKGRGWVWTDEDDDDETDEEEEEDDADED